MSLSRSRLLIYIYGIDLAESLNYWAIYVNKIIQDHVEIQTIRKGKDTLYPELEAIILNELVPKYPPKEIVVDYTSEKAFSEWLETKLHPAFRNPNSSQYKKWKFVQPIIFSQPVKLNMKQNARQMMEGEHPMFRWPDLAKSHPVIAKWVEETKEQLLREAQKTARGGTGLTKAVFPKPIGYDNDLAMALELSLLGCRKYLGHFSGTGGKAKVHGARYMQPEKPSPKDILEKKIRERVKGFPNAEVDISFPS